MQQEMTLTHENALPLHFSAYTSCEQNTISFDKSKAHKKNLQKNDSSRS